MENPTTVETIATNNISNGGVDGQEAANLSSQCAPELAQQQLQQKVVQLTEELRDELARSKALEEKCTQLNYDNQELKVEVEKLKGQHHHACHQAEQGALKLAATQRKLEELQHKAGASGASTGPQQQGAASNRGSSPFDDLEKLQARLRKAEMALEQERIVAETLRRQVNQQRAAADKGAVASEQMAEVRSQLQAAQQDLAQRVRELEQAKAAKQAAEDAAAQLKQQLAKLQQEVAKAVDPAQPPVVVQAVTAAKVHDVKASPAGGAKSREEEVIKIRVRAAEDRAQAAEGVCLDLQRQCQAAAATIERLIDENTALVQKLNGQATLLAQQRTEVAKREAAIRGLEAMLMQARTTSMEVFTAGDRDTHGDDQGEVHRVSVSGQGHSLTREASSQLLEGLSEGQWKLRMLVQEVQGMQQELRQLMKAQHEASGSSSQEHALTVQADINVGQLPDEQVDAMIASLAREMLQLEEELQQARNNSCGAAGAASTSGIGAHIISIGDSSTAQHGLHTGHHRQPSLSHSRQHSRRPSDASDMEEGTSAQIYGSPSQNQGVISLNSFGRFARGSVHPSPEVHHSAHEHNLTHTLDTSTSPANPAGGSHSRLGPLSASQLHPGSTSTPLATPSRSVPSSVLPTAPALGLPPGGILLGAAQIRPHLPGPAVGLTAYRPISASTGSTLSNMPSVSVILDPEYGNTFDDDLGLPLTASDIPKRRRVGFWGWITGSDAKVNY